MSIMDVIIIIQWEISICRCQWGRRHSLLIHLPRFSLVQYNSEYRASGCNSRCLLISNRPEKKNNDTLPVTLRCHFQQQWMDGSSGRPAGSPTATEHCSDDRVTVTSATSNDTGRQTVRQSYRPAMAEQQIHQADLYGCPPPPPDRLSPASQWNKTPSFLLTNTNMQGSLLSALSAILSVIWTE